MQRIAFFVEYINTLANFEPLIRRLRDDPDFEPVVIAFRNRLLKSHLPEVSDREFQEQSYQDLLIYLKKLNCRVFEATTYEGEVAKWLEHLTPAACFYVHPFDDARPEYYRAENVSKTSRVIYVPYAFAMAKSEQLYFGNPFYSFCWKIFVEGPSRLADYMKRGYDPKRVCATGLPKLDMLRECLGQDAPDYWPSGARSDITRKRIIWAPHWTLRWYENPSGYGQFQRYAGLFTYLARSRPQWDIVLRPHPLMFSELIQSKTMTEGEVTKFIHDFNSFPNTKVDGDGPYYHAFASADVLVSDGVSFLGEFLITRKPIIYLRNPLGPGFNTFGEKLVSADYHVTYPYELEPRLTSILEYGLDPLRNERERVIQTELGDFNTAAFVQNYLKQELRTPI